MLAFGPAVIAALVSVGIGGGISYWSSRRIERLRAELSELGTARKARQDYEYEARKRLYTEIEPLLFQAYEAAEGAYYRVKSLARTSRSGRLGGDEGSWVRGSGYYLRSTAYILILPAVIFRLMQRRITFIDLSVDSRVKMNYYLLKFYYVSFTDHYDFAKLEPELRYDPSDKDWQKLSEERPDVYLPQGLVIGDLDNVLDALITGEDSKSLRPKTFGEFEVLLDSREDASLCALDELTELYREFSPESRPILARMLVAQACLSHLLVTSYNEGADVQRLRQALDSFVENPATLDAFSWHEGKKQTCLKQARAYAATRLDWIPDI